MTPEADCTLKKNGGQHQALGVDPVLAELKKAGAAAPGEPRLAAMYAVVRGQAHHLRDREAASDPGFVPRQLCLQAAELGDTLLAADFRTGSLPRGSWPGAPVDHAAGQHGLAL